MWVTGVKEEGHGLSGRSNAAFGVPAPSSNYFKTCDLWRGELQHRLLSSTLGRSIGKNLVRCCTFHSSHIFLPRSFWLFSPHHFFLFPPPPAIVVMFLPSPSTCSIPCCPGPSLSPSSLPITPPFLPHSLSAFSCPRACLSFLSLSHLPVLLGVFPLLVLLPVLHSGSVWFLRAFIYPFLCSFSDGRVIFPSSGEEIELSSISSGLVASFPVLTGWPSATWLLLHSLFHTFFLFFLAPTSISTTSSFKAAHPHSPFCPP